MSSITASIPLSSSGITSNILTTAIFFKCYHTKEALIQISYACVYDSSTPNGSSVISIRCTDKSHNHVV
jgi:hypothetical protein